jgi:hypothetical protein
MKNDFTSLYTGMNKDEQKEFRQYVTFFYGQQKSVVEKFDELIRAPKPRKAANALTEQSDKNTLNAASDLKKWLLEYLTIQEIKSNSFDAKFLTLEALRKRGLKEAVAKKSTQLNQELKGHSSPDMWLTLMKLRLAHIDYYNTDIDKLKDYQAPMHKLLNELDNFYISTKLKYSAELENRKAILQENYTPRLLNEILVLIDTDNSIHPVIKNLYLPLLELIKEKSETAFQALKSFLANEKSSHDKLEKLSVLVYLMNFTAQRIRKGEVAYYQESFELAKIGIDQKLFTAAGYFPTSTFNNIVSVGCHLKKYEWTKDFIETWHKKLKPEDEMIAHNLALARILFEEKNFGEAIDCLNKIEQYRNVHFTLHIRLLMARCYYEYPPITINMQNAYCNALELYIRRDERVSQDLKRNTLNFMKILRYLINGKSKKYLQDALDSVKDKVAFPEWLQEKI